MRKVIISPQAMQRIANIEIYLIYEIKLSETATTAYTSRIRQFLSSLSAPADYGLCRFKEWRNLEYHCTIFEKTWVIAYEAFDNGIIVRDIRHTRTMRE